MTFHKHARIVVALRKESVDRNWMWEKLKKPCTTSLSARRAWIEISGVYRKAPPHASLSARRAWIEITIVAAFQRTTGVALRKESVDRNP